MRAYIAYNEDGIEELGDINKERVIFLIDSAYASLASEKQFWVGFYRSEKDFLEIRPVGKSECMIWSDVIAKSQSLGLLEFFFRRKIHISKIVVGPEAAAEAVYYYIDYSREEFELKYS